MFIDIALEHIGRGWAVFPLHYIRDGLCSCKAGAACKTPSKHPTIFGWQHQATTNEAALREWARYWPHANCGIACGPSRLVVLDIDPRHGGDDSLRCLLRRYGPLPQTVEALTGSGGRHHYFHAPATPVPNTQGLSGFPGLDIRGSGGYVVAVGSDHISGRRYEWEVSSHPDDVPLAPLPLWLAEIARRNAAKKEAPPIGETIPDGERNGTLLSLAGTMRRRGMSEKAILAALLVTNTERCRPPLDREEVETIAASAARYAPEEAKRLERGPKTAQRTADLNTARTFSSEEVSAWLS